MNENLTKAHQYRCHSGITNDTIKDRDNQILKAADTKENIRWR